MAGTAPQTARSLQQFVAGFHKPREPVALVHHLLSGLQAFIPTEYNSWKEVSFQRGHRVTAVFSPHNPEAASLLPVFQRHVDYHPICTHWRKSGQYNGAISWTDVTSRSSFEKQDLYSEFYRPLGIQHQLAVALDVRASQVIYLALNRTRSPFTEQERNFLTAVQSHASQALHHLEELHRLQSALASYETLVDRLNQGIICLSPTNRINWASKRARGHLQTYWDCSPQTMQLPNPVMSWLLLSQQRRNLPQQPIPPLTIHNHTGRLVIRLLTEKKDRYLFLEETSAQPTFTELTTLGLTEREAEVLGWIAQGKSNEETAALLRMGYQTVKKHLERIYDVLGVANRTEAALKAQGVMRHAPQP